MLSTRSSIEAAALARSTGRMPKAVRFDNYGDLDVLQVVDVDVPSPGPGQVQVRVKAAGINPGEASIRKGLLHDRWPATFPSGQGSDLAGVVEQSADDRFSPGDEVLGFTDTRTSQAELVLTEGDDLTPKPAGVSWEAAGALHVVGSTAWAAVRAVGVTQGDVVGVSGAAGGVGTVAIQLARNAGAQVIALASEPHHAWLREHGAIPVSYGDGLADRLREYGLTAFIDTFGNGYVDLAIELGVAPERIDTIIDYAAATRHGVKMDGNSVGASAPVLAELAQEIAEGRLEIPIAGVFPLGQVREAYGELERRHTLGKIVLEP
jgi:NADPH:quinone reductase-like Zn-dependent oxidoreductase